jgi:hypothetical protein
VGVSFPLCLKHTRNKKECQVFFEKIKIFFLNNLIQYTYYAARTPKSVKINPVFAEKAEESRRKRSGA